MIKKKNQKPTNFDLYLKYTCPNNSCGCDHWLSLKETQTKKYKVVCDCGGIFFPKRIDNIRIKYVKSKKITKSKNLINTQPSLDTKILDKCISVLETYGFTKTESQSLLNKAYSIILTNDATKLIKKSLELIGAQKNV